MTDMDGAYKMRQSAYENMVTRVNVSQVLSALSEPIRMYAMQIFWDGGEHCVCELMDRLHATQSRMSRHMAALKAAGLVIDRRDAQWVRYRCNPDLPQEIARIVEAVVAAIENNKRAAV
ncbi:MAG: metalloregulator ArsR/SmtB family transcription factor [Rhodospirillales bacterium]|nr:metalloregulator ArsR/SmtB family transcription factor [Rhodospirillales bacterium]